MATAGIREARQNLSALLERVKQGEEITITDRGKPVAVVSAPKPIQRKPFPDMREIRKSLNVDLVQGERVLEMIRIEEEDRN